MAKAKILAEASGYDPHERTLSVIASTPNPVRALDADGKPILESLVGWDLERFTKAPRILYQHKSDELPIGRALEYEVLPDGGLKIKLQFRPAGRSALVDEIAGCFEDGFLNTVSVGFEPGESTQNADGSWTRRNNELLELSVVTIPADEDAGDASVNPDAAEDDERKRVSTAASELARARARIMAARKEEIRSDHVDHFDAERLSKVEWTPWGAARIPARFCRVGVLDYPGRRELRPESEVFKADSLATMKGVPVIDIVDHTAYVLPEDFRQKVLGFVEEAHVDGDYVAGTLLIHDGPTIEAIKRGERLDISAGYYAPTDPIPGEWRGERYDRVQRDIIYNHVALCPPGRGRAGAEVGLKLDAKDVRVSNGAGEVRPIRTTGARAIRAT